MVESQKFRLLVDLSDLRNHDPDLAARCLVRPIGYILAFEQALKRVTVEGVLGLFEVYVCFEEHIIGLCGALLCYFDGILKVLI